MKKIILISAFSEIIYLSLSFAISQVFDPWSVVGEIIRTDLRIVSILFFWFYYQKYFYSSKQLFKTKEILTVPFMSGIVLLITFAIAYTNAENESLLWQVVFMISGMTAGLREELFYRGMIQNTLQLKYDYKIALMATTLLFSLSHIQYIYEGQARAILLITFAGIIFGSVFIHTRSVVFTGMVHGLYDAVLSVNMVPFRLSNGAASPILFLIMLIFLGIISKKLYLAQQTDNTDDNDQDSFSLP